MSGYRFVLRAAKLGIPVAIVNVGPTRGDAKADVRVDAPLGVVLPAAACGRPASDEDVDVLVDGGAGARRTRRCRDAPRPRHPASAVPRRASDGRR